MGTLPGRNTLGEELFSEGGAIIEEEKAEEINLQQKREIEEKFADKVFTKIAFGTTEPPIQEKVFKSSKFGRSKSPIRHQKTIKKKEKHLVLCEVDFDCQVRFNCEIYIPGLGLKKDMGLRIIGVQDIKDVSFWVNNVS
jgi:hypothetical protein